jgi:hypothetical protein
MRTRVAWLGGVLILLSAAGCVTAAPADQASPSAVASRTSATPSASASFDLGAMVSQYLYFSDWQTGARFDVFLGYGDKLKPAVVFYQPGLGMVSSNGQVQVQEGPSGITVTYAGPGSLDTSATWDPVRGPSASSSGAPNTLQVSLAVDAAHDHATVQGSIGTTSFSASSYGHPPAADTVVSAYSAALTKEDWGALYDMLMPTMRATTTRTQFITQARTGGDPGTFVSVTPTGLIAYSCLAYPAARATLVVVHRDSSGATTTENALITFIWDSGAWYVLGSHDAGTKPSPGPGQ